MLSGYELNSIKINLELSFIIRTFVNTNNKDMDMEQTTKQNSPIKVGDYVKWNDIAVHEYDECDREDMLNRIFKVFAINGDVYSLADYYSEVEALEHELVKVEEPYFVDCDWFHLEDEMWHGDLGYEVGIDDFYCYTLDEVKSAIKYDLEAMRELGELNDKEVIRFSAVKGVYDFEIESWRCPYISEDRESYVVYRYFNATKELADKYGIVADEYAE